MLKNTIYTVFAVIVITAAILSTNITDGINSTACCKNSREHIASWTVMYYMCGDSKGMNEHIDPLLNNLSRVGSTDDLNIIALVDKKGVGDSKLYYIDKNGDRNELNDVFGWPDELDTGSSITLETYCKQIMHLYPAKHYALITYASGGTGWQLYSLHDSSSGKQGLTIPAFANTLKNITTSVNHKIDVLFVSCAMGMTEVAYEISPYVDYMVSTEDCLSREHLVERFYQPVWDLKNNTNMSPEEFTKKAPARLKPISFYYMESYYGKLPFLNKILNKLPFPGLHTVVFYDSTAVVNLSKINNLINAVNDLSSFLILNIHKEDVREGIEKTRLTVREYGKCFPKLPILGPLHWTLKLDILEVEACDHFVDLYDFAEKLKNSVQNPYIQNLCNIVMERLNETIPAIKRVSGDPSHGLSIYLPSNKLMYNRYVLGGKIPCPYENLRFSRETLWDDFVKTYLQVKKQAVK